MRVIFESAIYPAMFNQEARAECGDCGYVVDGISLGSRRSQYIVLDDSASTVLLNGRATFLAICPGCTSLTTCAGQPNVFVRARCSRCSAPLAERDLVENDMRGASQPAPEGRLAHATSDISCPQCERARLQFSLRQLHPGVLVQRAQETEDLDEGQAVHATFGADGLLRVAGCYGPHRLAFVSRDRPERTDQPLELTVLVPPRIRERPWKVRARVNRQLDWATLARNS